MTFKEKALHRIQEMYKIFSSSASDITFYFAKQAALKAIDNEIALLQYILGEQENQCPLTVHMIEELQSTRNEIETFNSYL